MAEQLRRPEQISPKSSPRGSRSPAYLRTDSTGTLKTTISLGKIPSVLHSGPFYLMKDIPEPADLTGSSNLMSYYGLEHSYNKFCGKKVREELSAFLPSLPGNIDMPGLEDNSSLRSLIEKPPIIGKELVPLSGSALAGFRLHPGPLPDQYKMLQMPQKKKKHKKHKREGSKDGGLQEAQGENSGDLAHDKKHKKPKRTDEEREKKKRKKEKKKKKKHSPEHPLSQSSEVPS